jgi:hypothetical protein
MTTFPKPLTHWTDQGWVMSHTGNPRVRIGKYAVRHWRIFVQDDLGDWDYTGPDYAGRQLLVDELRRTVANYFGEIEQKKLTPSWQMSPAFMVTETLDQLVERLNTLMPDAHGCEISLWYSGNDGIWKHHTTQNNTD